jgi:hypothetical protein
MLVVTFVLALFFSAIVVATWDGPAAVAGASMTTNRMDNSRAVAAHSRPSAAEKLHARQALLVLSDLPQGWRALPGAASSSTTSIFAGAKPLAKCLGVPDRIAEQKNFSVNSPPFSNSATTHEVSDTVAVLPSVQAARVEWAAQSGPRMAGCIKSFVGPKLSAEATAGNAGVTVGTIHVARDASPPHTVAYTLTIPVTEKPVSIRVSVELVFFERRALGGMVGFYGYGPGSLSQPAAAHLISLLYSRL